MTGREGSSIDDRRRQWAEHRTDNGGDAAAGNMVWYAVRPEKIRVSSKKPDDQSLNAAEGEVWDIAYLGDMTVYHVKLDDGRIVRYQPDQQPAPDATIR